MPAKEGRRRVGSVTCEGRNEVPLELRVCNNGNLNLLSRRRLRGRLKDNRYLNEIKAMNHRVDVPGPVGVRERAVKVACSVVVSPSSQAGAMPPLR